jgi:hypothetical protein
MSGTTNILELPMENNNTPKMSFTEPVQQQGVALDENTISQIVSGLQRASVNGATLLPSRDIPTTTTNLSTDAQVQPNYIPPAPKQNDYIKNQEETDDISNQYNKRMESQNSLDEMYNELQTPFLLMVLYFLFQLRFYRKFLFNFFPILFSKDGNININGLFFNSILFGFAYYVLNKSTELFSRF